MCYFVASISAPIQNVVAHTPFPILPCFSEMRPGCCVCKSTQAPTQALHRYAGAQPRPPTINVQSLSWYLPAYGIPSGSPCRFLCTRPSTMRCLHYACVCARLRCVPCRPAVHMHVSVGLLALLTVDCSHLCAFPQRVLTVVCSAYT